MKYRVEKLNDALCSIKLVPENPGEEKLLAQPEKEESFRTHYQQALSKFVHKDAVFIDIVSREHYPGHVLVRYELPNGA